MKKTLIFAFILCFAAALVIYGCGTQGATTTSTTTTTTTTTTSTTTTTIADNPAYSNGTGTLEATCTFDFDEGVSSPSDGTTADVWWRISASDPDPLDADLTCQNDALLYRAGAVDFDTTTYEVVSTATFTTDSISNSNLANNTVVYVKTTAGRYTKFKVISLGYNTTIQWKTYQ